MSKYIDCHTHAQFSVYSEDREQVIERALSSGVSMINVGTQQDTSKAAVDLAHKYEFAANVEASAKVWACVGLHPIHTEKSFHDVQELGGDPGSKEFTSRSEEFDYEYYKKLALDPKTVAIGECGLDYFRLGEETKIRQKQAFKRQIELSRDVKKPLMIHCRGSANSPSDAFTDLVGVLRASKSELNSVPGVIHFFAGGVDDANKLLDLGFYFTFGGVVTFARSYDEVIKVVPLDRILSETDAPYVTPEPYRGKRNEPAYVVYVIRKLAELKGVTEDEMAEQVWENAKSVFQLT